MNTIIIAVILVIIIILLYLIVFVRKTDKYVHYPVNDYSKIRDKFKTGDIILFSCKKHNSIFEELKYYVRTNFIGSEYGHVGMILKGKKNNYLIECIDRDALDQEGHYFSDPQKGGIRIVNFDKLIKRYHKQYDSVFAVKFISKKIPNKIIFDQLKNYRNVPFQDRGILYIMAFIDMCVSHKLGELIFGRFENGKMICSEFIHRVLYKSGVLKDYPSKLFWPNLITSELFDDLTLVSYSEPYKFEPR